MKTSAVLSLALSAVTLGGCGPDPLGHALPPDRFRLTAEVETPEGVRTGSSVIEVQWSTPPKILGSQGSSGYHIKGEAVVVDLPKGQTLFVLLSSPTSVDWAASALDGTGLGSPGARPADRGPRPLPRTVKLLADKVDNYPYFVRFRDPGYPKTVELVDPDDLTKAFGKGIKLRSLTVQLTDATTTDAIRQRLPWVGPFPEPSLNPEHGPNDWSISAVLTHGAFRRGLDQ
jgi:hypothetical protein